MRRGMYMGFQDGLNKLLTAFHGVGDSTTRLRAFLNARSLSDGGFGRYVSNAYPGARSTTDALNAFVGGSVLGEAVFWVDAAHADPVSGTLRNMGTGGSALDAQFGSTAPSSYFNGTALVLNGVAGNYASTPDAVALDISGNLCLVADVAPTDWTPGSTVRLGGKDNAYVLNLNSTGQLALTYIDSGLVLRTAATSSPVGFADGARRQVAVTYVAGTGVNDVRFWTRNTSSDPWVQFGSTQSSAGVDIRVGGNAAAFGATDTGSAPLTGSLYRFSIYASVGASNEPPSSGAVFDADFAKPFDTTSFTATTGQTVTLNRSVSGVDTNDPTVLSHTGVNYLYLPGSAASVNFASIPDSGSTFVGDLSIAVEYDPTDRTTDTVLVLKRENGVDAGLIPFSLSQWTFGSGALKFVWADTAGTTHTLFGNVSVPAAAKWVGVQHDHDNGAGGNTAHFYWSADGTNWTLFNSITEAFVDPAGKRVNAAQIGVGGTNLGAAGAVGGYRRAKIWNSRTFSGAAQVDIDFTRLSTGAETSFTATTGQTVTINRSASGRKAVVVVRPTILLGTDDYFTATDSLGLLDLGASQDMTAIIVCRHWNATPGFRSLLGNRANGAVPNGWELDNNNGIIQGSVGVSPTPIASTSAGAWTAGSLLVGALIRDAAGLRTARNGTLSSNTSTATFYDSTINASKVLNIGARWNGTSDYADMEFVAAAVFRRALTAAEIAEINTLYGTA